MSSPVRSSNQDNQPGTKSGRFLEKKSWETMANCAAIFSPPRSIASSEARSGNRERIEEISPAQGFENRKRLEHRQAPSRQRGRAQGQSSPFPLQRLHFMRLVRGQIFDRDQPTVFLKF